MRCVPGPPSRSRYSSEAYAAIGSIHSGLYSRAPGFVVARLSGCRGRPLTSTPDASVWFAASPMSSTAKTTGPCGPTRSPHAAVDRDQPGPGHNRDTSWTSSRSGGRAARLRRWVRRSRTRLLRARRPAVASQPTHPDVPSAGTRCRSSRHPTTWSPAHVGHACPAGGGSPKGRPGTPWSLERLHHARHLLARVRGDGDRRGESRGCPVHAERLNPSRGVAQISVTSL